MEDEHNGRTALGRPPGARDGHRTAGHGNVEVRLEGLALMESLWEVAAVVACFRL
jgi:hypothetical protein